jgi:hypothetical protein
VPPDGIEVRRCLYRFGLGSKRLEMRTSPVPIAEVIRGLLSDTYRCCQHRTRNGVLLVIAKTADIEAAKETPPSQPPSRRVRGSELVDIDPPPTFDGLRGERSSPVIERSDAWWAVWNATRPPDALAKTIYTQLHQANRIFADATRSAEGAASAYSRTARSAYSGVEVLLRQEEERLSTLTDRLLSPNHADLKDREVQRVVEHGRAQVRPWPARTLPETRGDRTRRPAAFG